MLKRWVMLKVKAIERVVDVVPGVGCDAGWRWITQMRPTPPTLPWNTCHGKRQFGIMRSVCRA